MHSISNSGSKLLHIPEAAYQWTYANFHYPCSDCRHCYLEYSDPKDHQITNVKAKKEHSHRYHATRRLVRTSSPLFPPQSPANTPSVCVASIIRIYYLVTLQTAIDLTWIMGPIFIWSCLEPSIGILSACLPVMGPLLRAHYRNHWASSDKSTQDSDPYRHGAPRSKNWLSFSSSKRKQRTGPFAVGET